ncbi:hypothetical protein Dsin_001609 [Dipteronia sinensis]|uniref:PPIase cyclophilin-type domain-containing protein n=1 Tax=Dipteronia sinensis TaxID=43782 RepID=A0AAE0B549_9ROSI|nr:hypothetical protein Dsin_001609 [Dipteronia sinensis]
MKLTIDYVKPGFGTGIHPQWKGTSCSYVPRCPRNFEKYKKFIIKWRMDFVKPGISRFPGFTTRNHGFENLMKYKVYVLNEMVKNSMYVVFNGRNPGMYCSLAECHAQVDRFPRALYQKFNSTDEAYKAITIYVHPQNSIESSETVEENVSKKVQSTGSMGIGKNGKLLHYKGTIFHRVIPRCLFNGGDLTEGKRLGGESISGDSFIDENFINKHTSPGILSMANTGPGTNNSQFLICTIKTEWLDGNNVIFGQVIQGFDVMKAVKKVGSRSGLTFKPITVANCCQLS